MSLNHAAFGKSLKFEANDQTDIISSIFTIPVLYAGHVVYNGFTLLLSNVRGPLLTQFTRRMRSEEENWQKISIIA